MKSEKIFSALSDIDEELLLSCGSEKKNINFKKILTLAACFFIVFATSVLIYNFSEKKHDVDIKPNQLTTKIMVESESEKYIKEIETITVEYYEEECADDTRPWVEKDVSVRYHQLIYDQKNYFSNHRYIDMKNAKEKLADITVEGYDEKGNKHISYAGIYSIGTVSSAIAVAVKFDGTDRFYTYASEAYNPKNLGEMVSDIGLSENVNMQQANLVFLNNTKNEENISVISDVDDELIIEALFSNKNLKPLKKHLGTERSVEIWLDIPIVNMNGNITVYENGYFSVNFTEFENSSSVFSGNKISFYVGREATDRIFDCFPE